MISSPWGNTSASGLAIVFYACGYVPLLNVTLSSPTAGKTYVVFGTDILLTLAGGAAVSVKDAGGMTVYSSASLNQVLVRAGWTIVIGTPAPSSNTVVVI